MTSITEDSLRTAIRDLGDDLSRARAQAARAEGRMAVVFAALVRVRLETEAAARKGVETMPTADVELMLHRLWDVATGAAFPPEEGVRP